MTPEAYFEYNLHGKVIAPPPVPAGGFRFPGRAKVWVNTFIKPNWVHRWTMRVVFGFQWQAYDEYGELK